MLGHFYSDWPSVTAVTLGWPAPNGATFSTFGPPGAPLDDFVDAFRHRAALASPTQQPSARLSPRHATPGSLRATAAHTVSPRQATVTPMHLPPARVRCAGERRPTENGGRAAFSRRLCGGSRGGGDRVRQGGSGGRPGSSRAARERRARRPGARAAERAAAAGGGRRTRGRVAGSLRRPRPPARGT